MTQTIKTTNQLVGQRGAVRVSARSPQLCHWVEWLRHQAELITDRRTTSQTPKRRPCGRGFDPCKVDAFAIVQHWSELLTSNPPATHELPSSCFTVTYKLPLSGSSSARSMIKTSTRETQVKLTVSVPPSLHVLLRSWALCEGRELTSVVLQCVELSVRQLKSNGSIPSAAIRAYEGACDERLAVGGL